MKLFIIIIFTIINFCTSFGQRKDMVVPLEAKELLTINDSLIKFEEYKQVRIGRWTGQHWHFKSIGDQILKINIHKYEKGIYRLISINKKNKIDTLYFKKLRR